MRAGLKRTECAATCLASSTYIDDGGDEIKKKNMRVVVMRLHFRFVLGNESRNLPSRRSAQRMRKRTAGKFPLHAMRGADEEAERHATSERSRRNASGNSSHFAMIIWGEQAFMTQSRGYQLMFWRVWIFDHENNDVFVYDMKFPLQPKLSPCF